MTISQIPIQEIIFALFIITAILIFITQIIIEVLKSVISKNADKYNLATVIVAVALTVIAFIALFSIKGLIMRWYYFVAAGIYGVFIAYGAMVGYDKLIRLTFNAIKGAVSSYKEIKEGNNETDSK